MSKTRGRVTLPSESGFLKETRELMERWGADAIRDSDGTKLDKDVKSLDAEIYTTYFVARGHNEFAVKHMEECQQLYLMSRRFTAVGNHLEMDFMEGYFGQQVVPDCYHDPKKWWEVMDRTTGEPVPVSVAEGDSVVSGCVNTTGQLTVRVEKSLSESMVTRILDSVENAAASKPKIDRFITRFARVYTPIVVGAAVLTAIIPSLITGDWGKWVYTALTFLVMSCPCALVLSVPLAFFAGIGAGSKRGILFKGGQSMEAMSKIKAVIMDKTGTITKGDFTVQKIVGGDELLEICANCEQQSTHPIAESIVAAAKARNMELRRPEELEELAGRGIRAKLDGKEILCGNERLLTEKGVSFPKSKEYGTKVLVAVDGVYQGYLLIADTIKTGAENAVRALRDSGIETVMLTGDAEESAKEPWVSGKSTRDCCPSRSLRGCNPSGRPRARPCSSATASTTPPCLPART